VLGICRRRVLKDKLLKRLAPLVSINLSEVNHTIATSLLGVENTSTLTMIASNPDRVTVRQDHGIASADETSVPISAIRAQVLSSHQRLLMSQSDRVRLM
jgi:hypothetical protein